MSRVKQRYIDIARAERPERLFVGRGRARCGVGTLGAKGSGRIMREIAMMLSGRVVSWTSHMFAHMKVL